MKIIILTICLILVLIVSNADYNEAVNERKRYCDMVQLFESTNGQYGWPAYDGECE